MNCLPLIPVCSFQNSTLVTISDLIKQSYETYGFITNETIEKMRNAARLEVGQSLVESSKRSILRATMESAKFTRKELEVLYKWFEVNLDVLMSWLVIINETCHLTATGRASTSCLLG